jgi:hypothetical protein
LTAVYDVTDGEWWRSGRIVDYCLAVRKFWACGHVALRTVVGMGAAHVLFRMMVIARQHGWLLALSSQQWHQGALRCSSPVHSDGGRWAACTVCLAACTVPGSMHCAARVAQWQARGGEAVFKHCKKSCARHTLLHGHRPGVRMQSGSTHRCWQCCKAAQRVLLVSRAASLVPGARCMHSACCLWGSARQGLREELLYRPWGRHAGSCQTHACLIQTCIA